ncbi:MAG: hypothetical protein P4M14_00705 [Gammaproteobacteria bacterium]|nr:hypothetical protein [Gammaproteobacteria bacterium]
MRSNSVTGSNTAASPVQTTSDKPLLLGSCQVEATPITDETLGYLRNLILHAGPKPAPATAASSSETRSGAMGSAHPAAFYQPHPNSQTNRPAEIVLCNQNLEATLRQVQDLFPDISADQQTKLSFAVMHLYKNEKGFLIKESCSRLLSYINAERMSEEEAEELNHKIAHLLQSGSTLKKQKHEVKILEVIILLDQAIKKYKSESWLYLTRAGYCLYDPNRKHEEIALDLQSAQELHKAKIDKDPRFDELYALANRHYTLILGQFDISRKHHQKLLDAIPAEKHEQCRLSFVKTISDLANKVLLHNKTRGLDYLLFLKEFTLEPDAALDSIIADLSFSTRMLANPKQANLDLRAAEQEASFFEAQAMQQQAAFMIQGTKSANPNPEKIAAQLRKEKAQAIKLAREKKVQAFELAAKEEKAERDIAEAARKKAQQKEQKQKREADAEKIRIATQLATDKAEQEAKELAERTLRKDVHKTLKNLLDRIEKMDKREQKAKAPTVAAIAEEKATPDLAEDALQLGARKTMNKREQKALKKAQKLAQLDMKQTLDDISQPANDSIEASTQIAMTSTVTDATEMKSDKPTVNPVNEDLAIALAETIVAKEPSLENPLHEDTPEKLSDDVAPSDALNNGTPVMAAFPQETAEQTTTKSSPSDSAAATSVSTEESSANAPALNHSHSNNPEEKHNSDEVAYDASSIPANKAISEQAVSSQMSPAIDTTGFLLSKLNEQAQLCAMQQQAIAYLYHQQMVAMQPPEPIVYVPVPASMVGYPNATMASMPVPQFAMPNPYEYQAYPYANSNMNHNQMGYYGAPMPQFSMQVGNPYGYQQQGFNPYPVQQTAPVFTQPESAYARTTNTPQSSANHPNGFMSRNRRQQQRPSPNQPAANYETNPQMRR